MPANLSAPRVGIYVDTANMYNNGGSRMQYDVLREFACRDDGQPIRLNAYVTFDAQRATTDNVYRKGALAFHAALRSFGYKVIIKNVKWYIDDDNTRIGKANADLDLAVDALLQSDNLDRVLLATGDGDFVRVVQALQNKGCRVEVVAFNNVSNDLRQEADLFMSGYLVPNLAPTESSEEWGEPDSIVRGWCYYYNSERGFGYMRYLTRIDANLWITDSRSKEESPYETAFFHFSSLLDPDMQYNLPNYELVFEFRLRESTRAEGGLNADDIRMVARL